MAQFSGAVKLADLNDFIAPSQACVVNINGRKEGAIQLDSNEFINYPEVGAVQPQPRASPGFQQTAPSGPNGAIKVTLQDCLACSGCVTSAETVLLEHQSAAEFLSKLADPETAVVVSISPQSRAALAAFYGLSPAEALQKLTGFFKGLGVKAVLDTSTGRDFALLEAAAEFVQRYRTRHPELSEASRDDPMDVDDRINQSGEASSSGREALHSNGSHSHAINGHTSLAHGVRGAQRSQPADATALPMLASACPGWVCYAEKTHGDYVLPHISSTKSPQAVMGTLVKRHLAAQWGLRPEQIYHCAIMPCYDKKLEASREDFNVPGSTVAEVDSVLTSGEVQQLLEAHGRALSELPSAQLDSLVGGIEEDGQLYGLPGGSGGYLNYIFRTAAAQLFGQDLGPGPLPMRVLRNADFQEVSLEVAGRPALRFALAYGFRNIQTLVRKIKRRACEYDYVEIMACPSGCLNGGGQIQPQPGQSTQQLLDQLDTIYHDPQVVPRLPQDNPAVAALYKQWVGAPVGTDKAQQLLHTQYHKRDKSIAATVGDW
ncbi:Cytosolic iron-sulfur assembly component 3 [Coccomyxa sp. Obi]|nr:Cytosolic iron-sulfur assembly component 3 [Coccomyxa sp. Obi]